MSERIVQNPHYLKTICFSDECTFFLNGTVNKQNVRYWCDENPHVFREGHTQFPQKLNVWAGILGNHIVGPLFLDETLTGQLYLDLLEDLIHPLIIDIVENNEDEFGNVDITFQQDGAPPHYSVIVRNFLNTNYPGRWIGRRGPTEWPPRSPDLTPLDFFLWGYLKSKVYQTEPESLIDLRQRIVAECRRISESTFINVRSEIANRLFVCQEVGGAHFEHLLR